MQYDQTDAVVVVDVVSEIDRRVDACDLTFGTSGGFGQPIHELGIHVLGMFAEPVGQVLGGSGHRDLRVEPVARAGGVQIGRTVGQHVEG